MKMRFLRYLLTTRTGLGRFRIQRRERLIVLQKYPCDRETSLHRARRGSV